MNWIEFGRESLEVEANAILLASRRLGASFEAAIELLENCRGKIIITGVGKSGIAAKKIGATLTSTGCPAVFLHPTEAMHGDLGIVAANDVAIALSNSGESEELSAILPAFLARGVPIIAIVGNLTSTLAQRAAVCLDASIEREACPLNLAPTTSVVVAMALGDALAMTLQKKRGFREEDYALNHPGGRLGRRLTLRVRDLMRTGVEGLPSVSPESSLMHALQEISAKSVGATCVTDENGVLLGLITDYDVRKAFQEHGSGAMERSAEQVMTRKPALTLHPDQLAYEAMRLMEERPRPLSVAPVVDDENRCQGMALIHDFVRAGL